MIAERRKYYNEDEHYKMINGDARESDWLTKIPYNKTINLKQRAYTTVAKIRPLRDFIDL